MKRLVICCDGTWQRIYRGELTNVALTARAVSPRDNKDIAQIVYYDAGVGASVSGLNLWNGMTGDDLDTNLLDAYLFINLNYEPGDQLYLFGFSRGAYTVRSLAGMLRKCGVLRREHVDKAGQALDLYRDHDVAADSVIAHRFRAAHAIAWPVLTDKNSPPEHDLRIRFVGVWDTVGALGIPRLLPFSLGVNKRYAFHDTALSRSVEYARHAVAIDEKRRAFTPALWNNVARFNPPMQKRRVLQAWFPGDHGAVGGGPSRGLSNCALLWVLEGAEDAGLVLSREPGSVLSGCMAEIDPLEASLQSSKGFSLVSFFGGQRWRDGLDRFEHIHETARLRWVANKRYRPKPLQQFGEEIETSLAEAAAKDKTATNRAAAA